MVDLNFEVDPYIVLYMIIAREYKDQEITNLKNYIIDNYNLSNIFPTTQYFLKIKNDIKKITREIEKSNLINDDNKLYVFINTNNSNLVDLQNLLYNKYRYAYKYIMHCYKNNIDIDKTFINIINSYYELASNNIFVNLYKEVLDFRDKIIIEWNGKKDIIISFLENIMRIKITGKFIMLCLSPRIFGGQNIDRYFNKNIFYYGHHESWDNYNVVYITHEILHSFFDYDDINHCIIQFIADNELRMKLNNSKKYFEENGKIVGHKRLRELENKILPYWIQYLSSTKNIYEFRDEMKNILY